MTDATVTELKVFTGGGQSVQSACGQLADEIKSLIYQYSGRIPLAAAIGVLEIVKSEITDEHR